MVIDLEAKNIANYRLCFHPYFVPIVAMYSLTLAFDEMALRVGRVLGWCSIYLIAEFPAKVPGSPGNDDPVQFYQVFLVLHDGLSLFVCRWAFYQSRNCD